MIYHKANGDLNVYGELRAIHADLALCGEPDVATTCVARDGLVYPCVDERWPGAAPLAPAPTRDACETVSDSDVTTQQREGGPMPAPRKTYLYKEVV